MLWSVQSMVQSGALWGQIAKIKVCGGQRSQWCIRQYRWADSGLRYVVFSAVSGAVGSIVRQIANIKVCLVSSVSGAVGSIVRYITNIKVCCGQLGQWCSLEQCGTDCQD